LTEPVQPVELECRICGAPIQRAAHERAQPWVHIDDFWEPLKDPLKRSQYDHDAEPDVIDVEGLKRNKTYYRFWNHH
jgi:hypothetical protein